MRISFINTLTELAADDPRIVLLTADLGYTVLERFADRFPSRFFNVGVAEQNMVGLATGLAEAGFIPFVYSIATFASMRAYEFIRNGPVLHHLPVRIVGVGGGFEYGSAGPTHHAVEDIGILRLQPGLAVIAPADYRQAQRALESTWNRPGPIYFRLGKDEKTVVPGLSGAFHVGRAEIVRQGSDLVFIVTGSVAAEVAAAADHLANEGVECSVAVVASLSPSPQEQLAELASRHSVALTVEAHYVIGGLGSLVSEVVAARGLSCRVIKCGVTSSLGGSGGSEPHLLSAHGLSRDALVATALRAMHGQSVG